MKTVFFSISVLLLCTFFTHQSFSQSRTANPNQNLQLLPSQIVLPQAVCGETTITQSISQTISGPEFGCNTFNIVRESSFYRAFDLSSFGLQNDFEVCQVQIGIDIALAGGSRGQQPATVNLYTSSQPFPTGFPGSLNLIGTTGVIQIADQQESIVTIPVTGTAPLDSELVVELFIPDGLGASNIFFIGHNSLGETGPSYVRDPPCGAQTPVSTASVGFPNIQFVMNVTGNELDPRTIALAPETAINPILTEHTVTATVDNDGVPEQGVLVTFEVMSGPNNGEVSDPDTGECTPNADCTTDANGQVSWTYIGSRNFGTDTISASFTNLTGGIILSNFAQKTWVEDPITIALAPQTATNPILTEHTVTATVDNDGVPEQGMLVTFEVMSGPNQGTVSESELSVSAANERQVSVRNSVACTPNADCTTDANGQVSWTYLGGRDVGTDTISASFINMNGAIIVSNFAQITWIAVPIPTLSQWGIISMAGILGLIGFIALRKRKAAA